MAAAADVPLLITSDQSSSERRVNPSWTIAHLKGRLEPITGVPAGCQRLQLRVASHTSQAVEAADEEGTRLQHWPLQPYAEIHVTDTRPPGLRTNYTDVSAVPKYELPLDSYGTRQDTVLAFKKSHQLGRFDPAAPSTLQQKIDHTHREIAERRITLSSRIQLLPAATDGRRGTVRYLGPVPEIPGVGAWVGVELDEPVGRNDGSVGEGEAAKRYFRCEGTGGGGLRGVFVRAERVEVGEFAVLGDELDDDEGEF